jgi:hypothetical protein
LDDYANIADAFIALYEVTFNEQYLLHAKNLVDLAIAHYYDETNGMFFYTADDDEQLIARKLEILDGVTPASNSAMARNLRKLGLLFDNRHYDDIAATMLGNIFSQIEKYPSAYANWLTLLTEEVFGTFEIAVTGDGAEEMRREMEKNYIPNKIMLGGKQGTLPLLEDKNGDTTRIFICRDRSCGLPANSIADALKQTNQPAIN